MNSGVRNECDPALALLSDYVMHSSNVMRLGAVVGLGLAYAGSDREDVIGLLLPVIGDSKSSMEVVSMAALACGMVAVGSCNDEVTSTLLQTLMEKSEAELKDSYAKFIALGLGLTYFGRILHVFVLHYFMVTLYNCCVKCKTVVWRFNLWP